jgi:hypothetical protein
MSHVCIRLQTQYAFFECLLAAALECWHSGGMAIAFARARYISRSDGGSAVRSALMASRPL